MAKKRSESIFAIRRPWSCITILSCLLLAIQACSTVQPLRAERLASIRTIALLMPPELTSVNMRWEGHPLGFDSTFDTITEVDDPSHDTSMGEFAVGLIVGLLFHVLFAGSSDAKKAEKVNQSLDIESAHLADRLAGLLEQGLKSRQFEVVRLADSADPGVRSGKTQPPGMTSEQDALLTLEFVAFEFYAEDMVDDYVARVCVRAKLFEKSDGSAQVPLTPIYQGVHGTDCPGQDTAGGNVIKPRFKYARANDLVDSPKSVQAELIRIIDDIGASILRALEPH